MTPPELVILLSGPIAVGKTTLRKVLLDEHGFDYVRSSDYLKQLAADRALSDQRAGLQDLGDDLDRQTDYRWPLDNVALPAMERRPDQQRWLVDAVRKPRQVEHFRDALGRSILHIHLTASEDVLRQRYAVRGDSTPYETVIAHSNEEASRCLIHLADLVLDVSHMPAERAAADILEYAKAH